MPWAANGRISTSPIDGGIEISDVEYQTALNALLGGKLVSVEDGSLSLTDPPAPDAEPEPPLPALPEYAALRRWQVEVGGTVWNDWPVHTDRASQAKVVAEMLAIERGERLDGDGWKFADGRFRPLTNAEFSDLALAVRTHVREAFAREAQVLAGIETGAITSQEEIDAALMPQVT